VVPFLGAGCPISSGLPTAATLAKILAAGAPREATNCGCPCSACASSTSIALDTAASYFWLSNGEKSLWKQVADQLVEGNLSSIHKCLARVGRPLLVITTNYDLLLEKAFLDRPFDVLTIVPVSHLGTHDFVLQRYREGEISETKKDLIGDELARYINLEQRSLIFKIHGSVFAHHDLRPGRFLIAEEHYEASLLDLDRFLPPVVLEHLDGRRLLFLGYSLRDWNVRVILRRLTGRFVSEGIAVARSASELDKKLWKKRNLEVERMEIDDFVEKLTNGG
jgi:hypothetical protein